MISRLPFTAWNQFWKLRGGDFGDLFWRKKRNVAPGPVMDQVREPCQLLWWSSKSRVAALPQTYATACCLDVTLPCWVPCTQTMPRQRHLPQLSIHNSTKYQHDSVQNNSNCTRIPQTPCQVCRVGFASISFITCQDAEKVLRNAKSGCTIICGIFMASADPCKCKDGP